MHPILSEQIARARMDALHRDAEAHRRRVVARRYAPGPTPSAFASAVRRLQRTWTGVRPPVQPARRLHGLR